jgi:AmmeMemoRadiSam system protein A
LKNYKNMKNEPLTKEEGKILLDIVRQTVEDYIQEKKIPEFKIERKRLKEKEGAFVTIRKESRLRGCIGQIISPGQPLWELVRDMAVAAASQDYRFEPISPKELKELDYEISILSLPKEIENWKDIKLGRHGVIIERGSRSGIFLPQVAKETSWNLEEFLSELCSQKTGIAPDAYKNDPRIKIKIFTTQTIKEA